MNKKTLIIIPGWGSDKEKWHEFVQRMKAYIAVEVIELPCFGNEPCPQSVWGVEEYAQFVKQKIEHYASPIVLGHSFGGAVAAQLVASYPHTVQKLILVGAAIIRPKKTIKRNLFLAVAKIGKCIFQLPILHKHIYRAKKILYKAADSPDYEKTIGKTREIYKKIIRQDIRDILPNIKQETIIIWGEYDSYTPIKQMHVIQKLMPHAKVKIIKSGTHGLHHQPFVDEFCHYVKQEIV